MDYEKVSQQYKVPAPLVRAEYEKILAELTAQGELTGDELLKSAIELTHLFFRTQNKSKGELYHGIVFGYDSPRDTANPKNKKSRRTLAVEAYAMDPEAALAKGTVAVLEEIADAARLKRTVLDKKTKTLKEDVISKDALIELAVRVGDRFIVPLDDVEKWGTGSENISYLRPLPLHSYTSKIVGVVQEGKQYKRFELNYQRPVELAAIPMNVPLDFKAIPKGEEAGVLKLNASTYTQFVLSDKDMGAEPLMLLEVGFKPVRQAVSTLHEYHEKLKNKYDSLVLVEGWVQDLRLESTMPSFMLDDLSSEPVKVSLHDGIPINFGVRSKVLVVGRTSIGDKWTPETGVQKGVPGDLSIFALGIYPKFNTKPKNLQPVETV